MEHDSISAYLGLSIPTFSETSTPQEDAAAMGKFLSAALPLLSVAVVRFEKERCIAADWSAVPCSAEISRLSVHLASTEPSDILAYANQHGIAQGASFDEFLKLEPSTHAIAHILYYAQQPCGCLIVCHHDDLDESQLRLLKTSRDLLNAACTHRLSLESAERTGFVFNTIMNSMKTSIYVTELETNRILFMNQTMKEEFGLANPEGKLCYKLLKKDANCRCTDCPVEKLLHMASDTPSLQWDEQNDKTGRSYHNYDSLIHWMDGSIVHLQQSIDVTDLKAANTDELTKLMNRRTGKKMLERTLKQARAQAQTLTVCFLDINNLKIVNDQFGHAQGDRLITAVATTVREFLREGEYAFRMSGDEFIIVFLTGEKSARHRLLSVQENLRSLEAEYSMSFCFGLVEVPPDFTISVEDALLLADERMYEQKRKYHIARNAERLRLAPKSLSSDAFEYDANRLYSALARSTDDYPFICNMKTGIFRYAPAMVDEFDLPSEVIENAAAVWGAKVHEDDKAAFLEANQVITDGRAMEHCVEYRVINRRGEWVWVRCRGHVELDELGDASIFAGFISNLGKQNKIDHLTGLFNKLEFEERVRRHIDRYPQVALGVVMLGLDDLKHVNDLYDRSFGDEVIRITAQRLQVLLPDDAELYRLDGDEFGVVLYDASENDLRTLCHTVSYSFECQQEYKGRKFYCTLSGGSVLYPRDANNYLNLAKYASYCLSYAKRHGKNCCVPYTSGILDHRARGLEMVEHLRSSVRNAFEGFSLHYQPLVEASTGRLLGAEALLRWGCEQFGQVSPVEFIPLLEQTGMIIPVGKWVLSTAIQHCAPWLEHRPDFVLNVNLSYLQIQGAEFVPFVLRVLDESQFPSINLMLELTESYFVRDNRHVQDIFGQLRERGVRIAVDDFGTGFSSLSILKNIPADEVKIDKTFIRDIRTSSFDATFIRFVVELCHDVGLSVCLEGVETVEEYEIVKAMGLDILQGFYFSCPITGAEFEARYF